MLHSEQLAGAGKAGLHLIHDQHDAMGVADCPQAGHEPGGHLVEAALALHRLDQDRRHAGGFQIGLEQAVERGERILGGDALQRDREGKVPDIGHHRTEAGLVGLHLAGQRHAHEGAAVKAPRKGDDGRAAGMVAGDLHRILHRLGAGGGEERLLGPVARHLVVQPLGQGHVILVGHDLMAGMGEAVQLRLDRGNHLGMAVPGVHHGDAGGEVDVAGAGLVPDFRILGTVGIDLRGDADAAGDGGGAAVRKGGVGDRAVGHGGMS